MFNGSMSAFWEHFESVQIWHRRPNCGERTSVGRRLECGSNSQRFKSVRSHQQVLGSLIMVVSKILNLVVMVQIHLSLPINFFH